ncbi:MAG: DUF2382 domain-containing protein [Phormidesmis sp.]
MSLHKIGERHPNYRELYFDGNDLKGLAVYSAESHNVGTVYDLLVDDTDRLQYLAVQLKSQEKVLIPISRCVNVPGQDRIYVRTLNREEIKALSRYDERLNHQHSTETLSGGSEKQESQQPYQMMPLEQSIAVESTVPVEASTPQAVYSESYQSINAVPSRQRPIQLYEDRLITRKQRVKTGEVKISKHTVKETTDSAVPVTKEKIIIEIESVYGGETRIDFGDAQVAEDGSVRMDIYEDQVETCRQVVPYQNVSIRKETVQDTVRMQETLRREELTVNEEGTAYVDWVDSTQSDQQSGQS